MKLKIVWICHFTNNEVQSIIKPLKRIGEFASWITYTLKNFEDRDEVELHIVSPHEYIPFTKNFTFKGIHYHYFNPNIPIWGRHWPGFLRYDKMTNYRSNKSKVRKIVEKIKPDIIHLQGAENPYYSSTIFQFKNEYPVVINLQRLKIALIDKPTEQLAQREKIEQQICKTFDHFSIRTKTMEKDLRLYKPSANIYWVSYGTKIVSPLKCEGKYDIVFFARVSKDKGIEDLMQALNLLKERIPDLSLLIIGGVNKSYKEYLIKLVKDHKIKNSIVWKGYLPTLDDVHWEASKGKISVLPTHYDIISGTIIESMQLGLPVVSYTTGSIPELNKDRENVLLVEKGNIQGLAEHIVNLLTDDNLYRTMSQRGIECMKQRFSNKDVLEQHLDCYKKVIKSFKNSHRKKDI